MLHKYIKDIDPITNFKVSPISFYWLAGRVTGPRVTKLDFNHEYISVFDNELLKSLLQ
jgi:hypothetical protein